MQVRSHKDLVVWQKAMDLAEQVFAITQNFPSSQQYVLVSQATRAAISVPANIAEGGGRGAPRDYCRFLGIAKGSLMELETYLMLATRLGYITEAETAEAMGLVEEVGKMLNALRRKLNETEDKRRSGI